MLKINKYLFSLILLSNIFTGCGGSSSSETTIDTSASAVSIISLDTKKSLAYMGNEERLAHDIYNKFYDLFPSLMQFRNIAINSETRHIEAVQQLVQKYEITGTELSDSNYTSLYYQNSDISQMQAGVYGVLSVQQLYDALLVEGSNDEISALKVGCKVEVTDIEDLNKYLDYANNDNASDCTISKKEFETIIGSVKSNTSAVHLVIFVHSVQEIDSGLYILLRNKNHKKQLQTLLKESFLWEKVDTNAGELYKLEEGDFKFLAKAISCNQDIASDGAFTLGMLAEFINQLETYGASRYKQLYWDCGAIGQQLYLETTSLGLSATGIGCFLDDILHGVIDLKTNHFQSLYHFTIGRGLIDNRLSTKKPYINR